MVDLQHRTLATNPLPLKPDAIISPHPLIPARPVEAVTNNPWYNDRAILDLKNQRDKLHQYQRKVTVLTDRETEIAKECLARNDRRRALLALRRKKYQESLLAKTDGQLAQLEQLTGQVEFALVQKDVLYGLQQGTQVLQTINKEMGGIEHVERLMGESEDARAYQEVPFPLCVDLFRLLTSTGGEPDAGWSFD